MRRKYFSTDGIRGKANVGVMTAGVALALGTAIGSMFRSTSNTGRVFIGKDTRLSCYMLEYAMTSGFVSAGMEVVLLGPVPTPAVAMLTRSLRADLGIVISASHNPYDDNGIKCFDRHGLKLSDDTEKEIEKRIDIALNGTDFLVKSADMGRVKRLDDARGRYIEYVKNTFSEGGVLDGIKVVLDCANGAAYDVGPTIFNELGADLVTIANSPDGVNINENCGAVHPKNLQQKVLEVNADIGIALDGDADRLVIVDEKGHIVDGNQTLAMLSAFYSKRKILKGGAVVSTVMANLGLEYYLEKHLGIGLYRANVGDRYVSSMMRSNSCNFGGEPSGHFIISDYSTTGDGLVTALQVLKCLKETNNPVSMACDLFAPTVQKLSSVPCSNGIVLNENKIKYITHIAEAKLGKTGRVVVRPSGTEPIIRIMAEGDDVKAVEEVIEEVKDYLLAAGH